MWRCQLLGEVEVVDLQALLRLLEECLPSAALRNITRPKSQRNPESNYWAPAFTAKACHESEVQNTNRTTCLRM